MESVQKLKKILLVNALFSGINGIAMIVFHKAISELMAISWPLILVMIGIGLLFFSSLLLWVRSRSEVDETQVKSIIIQDWLWVIGSFLIVLFQAFNLSFWGYEIITVVALVVAVFAFLQTKHLKKWKESRLSSKVV
jgi:hypothetical protein